MQIRTCIVFLNRFVLFCFLIVYSEYEVVYFCSMAVTCVETDARPEGIGADGEV